MARVVKDDAKSAGPTPWATAARMAREVEESSRAIAVVMEMADAGAAYVPPMTLANVLRSLDKINSRLQRLATSAKGGAS